MRSTLFIFAFSLFAVSLSAQTVETETKDVNANVYDDTHLLYRNEFTGGVLIHSRGFGLNVRRGKHITGYSKRLLELELVTMRHPKEVKTVNPSFDNSKGFYYGKLNSVIIMRPGLGVQKVIYTKPEKSGVEIRAVTMLGGSLAFAKPIYLEILNKTLQDNVYELTVERYDPAVHYIDDIYGRAPYFRGFNEMKIYPGGYAKLGLNFEYGSLDDEVKSIETGVVVDVYPKAVPIMATEKNSQVFVTLYLNFLYGRKWF